MLGTTRLIFVSFRMKLYFMFLDKFLGKFILNFFELIHSIAIFVWYINVQLSLFYNIYILRINVYTLSFLACNKM